jgi:hypothetical protein
MFEYVRIITHSGRIPFSPEAYDVGNATCVQHHTYKHTTTQRTYASYLKRRKLKKFTPDVVYVIGNDSIVNT